MNAAFGVAFRAPVSDRKREGFDVVFLDHNGVQKATKAEGVARVFESITYVIESKTRLGALRHKRKCVPVRASFGIQNERLGGPPKGPGPKNKGPGNAGPEHAMEGGPS